MVTERGAVEAGVAVVVGAGAKGRARWRYGLCEPIVSALLDVRWECE